MTRRDPRVAQLTLLLLCTVPLLQIVQAGCDRTDPAAVRVVPLPAGPREGAPARGALIDDATLDESIPPAPADAVPYEIQEPLRNGRTVPLKKRWVWIPEGTRITVTAAAGGRIGLELPVGTKLWKEFYMQAGPRPPRLVERRLLLKVPSRDVDNGWLLNGGWRFFTAHHLPARADGVRGFDGDLTLTVGTPEAQRFFFRPQQWLPTQAKGATTRLTLVSGAGAARRRDPVVFPGQTLCDYCHGGAAGGFANAEPRPVLAFALHPDNLTLASLRRLMQRGWLDAPAGLLERRIAARQRAASPSSGDGDRTRAVVAQLRNNCLSCHNSSPRAAAHTTAFLLDPDRSYGQAELTASLRARSKLMGPLALPMVTPGAPQRSELWLRLEGRQGRRRMPPAEGGVPELDRELIALATGWIEGLPADAPDRR